MRASSVAALRDGAERWEPVLREAGEEARTLGEQLYGVADLLRGSAALRRALSDPSRDAETKAGLARQVLTGHVATEIIDLVAGLVRSRWSGDADLPEALEELATISVLAAAQSRDALLQVEEELFFVERLLAGNRELRDRLSDHHTDPQPRVAIIEQLLTGRTEAETRVLVDRLVTIAGTGTLGAGLRRLGDVAAARRDRLVANVTAAAPLSRAQEDRLARILERSHGQAVHINVAIAPEILGGLRVQVGSEIIDGSMLTRLNDARRRFHG